jgi:ABC-type Na+ efflux pump permease subunit
MDIDKQIASLESKSVFSFDSASSPKLIVAKILTIFIVAVILTYIIKPMTIVKLKFDGETQGCSYEIIKKKFLIVSVVIAILLFFIISQFNII